MQTFELIDLLKNTLALHQQQAVIRNIELKIFDDLVSHVIISADVCKLKLLVDTVLGNTIEHLEATSIMFSTRQLLRTSTDVLLEFSIEHNGVLPKDHRRISYYRAHIRARKMVEEMRGKSEWNQSAHGSLHKFIIRCVAADKPEERLDLCSKTLGTKKILVVEDNEMNQKSLIKMLERQGIDYTMASDGKEAIELLEKDKNFDVVLMDLHMPRMDGHQTTTYIRKKLNTDIPVLGMSAEDHNEFALKCFEAGMNQFIRKPFTPELLVRQLCSFFEPVMVEMQKAISA